METGIGWIFLGMMADSAVMLIPEILIDVFLVKNKFKKNAVLYIDVLMSIYSIFKTLIVIYLIMYSVLAVPVIMLA
ncbi:MAG: hypothetical protein Q4D53_08275, partial [Leptotrichiaceae bacterium]|nr:hypothetical protein [Leptotrichiaceae bacterium]